MLTIEKVRTEGELPPKLAETINNMAWRIYSESEVTALCKQVRPPKNVARLQNIQVNDHIEETVRIWQDAANMYGWDPQANSTCTCTSGDATGEHYEG